LFSDHLGEAAVYFMINYSSDKIVNIGLGEDYSICELANLVKGIIGYNGDIKFDTSFPDGVMEKKLDVSYATSCGWSANYNLKNELQLTYNNYIKTLNK
jgi:GDP-L-fucose synthase